MLIIFIPTLLIRYTIWKDFPLRLSQQPGRWGGRGGGGGGGGGGEEDTSRANDAVDVQEIWRCRVSYRRKAGAGEVQCRLSF